MGGGGRKKKKNGLHCTFIFVWMAQIVCQEYRALLSFYFLFLLFFRDQGKIVTDSHRSSAGHPSPDGRVRRSRQLTAVWESPANRMKNELEQVWSKRSWRDIFKQLIWLRTQFSFSGFFSHDISTFGFARPFYCTHTHWPGPLCIYLDVLRSLEWWWRASINASKVRWRWWWSEGGYSTQ